MVTLAFNSSSPSQSRFIREPRPARIVSAWRALKSEWEIRRALRSVEALDARLLIDMGMAPGGIEDAVRHGR